jgi:hypothetical protein
MPNLIIMLVICLFVYMYLIFYLELFNDININCGDNYELTLTKNIGGLNTNKITTCCKYMGKSRPICPSSEVISIITDENKYFNYYCCVP